MSCLPQPVQLSDHLNSLLLSMCEDVSHHRVNLSSILEACESQHKALMLPPSANVIKQLVEEVFHESVSLDIWLFACSAAPHVILNTMWRCNAQLLENQEISSVYFLNLQMDRGSLPDSSVPLSGRSQIIRERLHGENSITQY